MGAAVGALTAVHGPMPQQHGALGEAAPTVSAREGTLAAVQAPVPRQHRALAESLATLQADKGALACVHTLVGQQVGALGKDPPTVRAAMPLDVWQPRVQGPFPRGSGRPHSSSPVLVGAQVAGQVGAAAETVATEGTGVGALTSVHTLVQEQARGAAEAAAALRALIGLFARVHAPVQHQVRATQEATPAVPTGERALASVNALVQCQVRCPQEALAAVPTAIRTLTCVDALVLDQGGASIKALAAVRAGEGALPGVGPSEPQELGAAAVAAWRGRGSLVRGRDRAVQTPVFGQVGALGEAAPTVGTGERALASVHTLVPQQVGAAAETPPTAVAAKRPHRGIAHALSAPGAAPDSPLCLALLALLPTLAKPSWLQQPSPIQLGIPLHRLTHGSTPTGTQSGRISLPLPGSP